MRPAEPQAIGVVVIGRNEGERLQACLRSLTDRAERIVYVDSGSTDGSVAFARGIGAEVVELDTSTPFTMARGRNAGFDHLEKTDRGLRFVQFVDGDCVVEPGWIERAARFLDEHPDVAAVCGRRRERHPDASIYNRLTDLEWDGPTGDVAACGGDALMRCDALRAAGGFAASMIAGEEPELCCRLRLAGWRVVRLDAEMTRHDAALLRFGQWWTRATRAGHAYAEGAWLHGRSRLRHNMREVRSICFWGLAVPAVGVGALVLGLATSSTASLLAGAVAWLGYPVLGLRIYFGQSRRGRSRRDAALYAAACVVGKLPNALGVLRFARTRNRRRTLIEYS